jgi:ComF family protein
MELKQLPSVLVKKINTIFSWIIPRRCINCAAHLNNADHPCCPSCYEHLPFQFHCCRQCGQALGAELDYCGRCLESPPTFDACFCPFRYESPVSDQIQKFKYAEKPETAKALARLLSAEIQANNISKPDLLIPVPMHISRLRARGFNQSLLLTKELSKLLSIPYAHNIIEKHRATPAQAKLGLKQRKVNLKGSFRLRSAPTAKNIAIIDDVFTTGSTAEEIAKILKKNGVSYVHLWGIAHTI